jgi:hypothetical protein
VVNAQYISRRISKVCLSPQPSLVHRAALELEACTLEISNVRVDILNLEIHHYSRGVGCAFDLVNRQRRSGIGLKSSIARWAVHDLT